MTSIRDLKPITEPAFESAEDELARLRQEVAAWRRAYDKGAKREIGFNNSSKEVEPLFTALDIEGAGTVADEVPSLLTLRDTMTLRPREVLLVTYDQATHRLRTVRGAQ